MIKKIALFVLILLSSRVIAEEQALRVNDYNDPNAAYAIKMLKLALAHTDSN